MSLHHKGVVVHLGERPLLDLSDAPAKQHWQAQLLLQPHNGLCTCAHALLLLIISL